MKIAKKHFFSFLLLSLLVCGCFFLSDQSYAANSTLWDKQEGMGADSGSIGEAFGSGSQPMDIRVVTARLIKAFLGILGTIMVIVIFFAGYKYMTAGGSEEKTKEALKSIMHAAIGLLIVISAFAITVFVETMIRRASFGVPW